MHKKAASVFTKKGGRILTNPGWAFKKNLQVPS